MPLGCIFPLGAGVGAEEVEGMSSSSTTLPLLLGEDSGVLPTLVFGVELNSEHTTEPESLQPVRSCTGATKHLERQTGQCDSRQPTSIKYQTELCVSHLISMYLYHPGPLIGLPPYLVSYPCTFELPHRVYSGAILSVTGIDLVLDSCRLSD